MVLMFKTVLGGREKKEKERNRRRERRRGPPTCIIYRVKRFLHDLLWIKEMCIDLNWPVHLVSSWTGGESDGFNVQNGSQRKGEEREKE